MLTDRLGKKDKSWYAKIPGYALMIAVPCVAVGLFAQHTPLALVGLGLCVFLQSTYLGPSLAVAHSLVPASMRALTSAVFFLVINLIGLGLGPLLIGMISDLLKTSLGVESLRWAMSVVIVVGLASAMMFFRTAGKMRS